MSFRARQIYNKLDRKFGDRVPADVMQSLKQYLPNRKIVQNRAKQGIFCGRHIQFGNQISEEGGNKSRRSWKPNIQDKRLFSYIHDRHIKVKLTTHALKCIDKAGGIDEYLLKTPYHKMDTELGLFWKAKIQKMYGELARTEVTFFSHEDEARIAEAFEELKHIQAEKASGDQTVEDNLIEGATTEGVKKAEPEAPESA